MTELFRDESLRVRWVDGPDGLFDDSDLRNLNTPEDLDVCSELTGIPTPPVACKRRLDQRPGRPQKPTLSSPSFAAYSLHLGFLMILTTISWGIATIFCTYRPLAML